MSAKAEHFFLESPADIWFAVETHLAGNKLEQALHRYEKAGLHCHAAAAAALKQELTLPEISQTLIATRTTMHASAMPEGEDLETLGKSGATLAIHLSIRNLKHIEDTLTPLYGEGCPVIVAYRVGWPDQQFIHGTLSNIREKMKKSKISRTALILVGRVFGEQTFRDSALYHPDHVHVLRPKTKKVSVG